MHRENDRTLRHLDESNKIVSLFDCPKFRGI